MKQEIMNALNTQDNMKEIPERWYICLTSLTDEDRKIVTDYYNSKCGDKIYHSKIWNYLKSHNIEKESILSDTKSYLGSSFSGNTSAKCLGYSEINIDQFKYIIDKNRSNKNKTYYISPCSLFDNKIPVGTLYVKGDHDNLYYPVNCHKNSNDVTACTLPSEIVEFWKVASVFKVGDWVKNTSYMNSIDQIIDFNKDGDPILATYGKIFLGCILPLNEEEQKIAISGELVEIARKDYPIGTVFIPAHSESNKLWCIVINEIFKFNDFRHGKKHCVCSITNNDAYYERCPYSLGNTEYDRLVYFDDKWAEIILSPPNVIVNNYKGKFFPTHVAFGCAEISKNQFLKAYELMSFDCKISNKKVNEIVFGEGKFDFELITKISDYYKKLDEIKITNEVK